MKAFYIRRDLDVHGNTGTGIVAEGVIFEGGKCVLRWLHAVASIVTFDKIEDVVSIHGHDGKSVVVLGEIIK